MWNNAGCLVLGNADLTVVKDLASVPAGTDPYFIGNSAVAWYVLDDEETMTGHDASALWTAARTGGCRPTGRRPASRQGPTRAGRPGEILALWRERHH